MAPPSAGRWWAVGPPQVLPLAGPSHLTPSRPGEAKSWSDEAPRCPNQFRSPNQKTAGRSSRQAAADPAATYNILTRRILTVDVNKKDCDSVSLDGSLWASQLFKCAQTRLQTAADSPADCCRTSARPFIAAGRSHLDKGECVTPSPLARPCPALAGHRMPPPGHLVLCPAWRARWRRGR